MVFAPAVLEKVHANLNIKFSKGLLGKLFQWAQVSGKKIYDTNDHTKEHCRVGAGLFYEKTILKIIRKF